MIRRCLQSIARRGLLAAPLLLLAAPVSAQTFDTFAQSFEHLRSLVRPGDTVTVESSGLATTGRVAELSPTTLQLTVGETRLTFDESEVTRIYKTSRGDPVKDGAAKGAFFGGFAVGFAVAMSVPALREQLLNESTDGQEAMGKGFQLLIIGAPGAIVGAGVGAIVDAFKRDTRRYIVYERLIY